MKDETRIVLLVFFKKLIYAYTSSNQSSEFKMF